MADAHPHHQTEPTAPTSTTTSTSPTAHSYRCNFRTCEASFCDEEARQRHVRSHRVAKTHPCPVTGCDRVFAFPDATLFHVESEHVGNCIIDTSAEIAPQKRDIWDCPACPYQGHSDTALKEHATSHVEALPFQCMYNGCSVICTTTGSAHNHIDKHINSDKYGCSETDECRKWFSSIFEMKRHRLIHQGIYRPISTCHDCQIPFWSVPELERHIETVHVLKEGEILPEDEVEDGHVQSPSTSPEPPDQVSPQSDWELQLANALDSGSMMSDSPPSSVSDESDDSSDQGDVHSNERAQRACQHWSFQCEYEPCGVSLNTIDSKNAHMDHLHNFRCTERGCRKVFASIQNLEGHARYHEGIQNPIQTCEECEIDFPRRNLLTSHRRVAHYTITCEGCTGRFPSAAKLKVHQGQYHLSQPNRVLSNLYGPACPTTTMSMLISQTPPLPNQFSLNISSQSISLTGPGVEPMILVPSTLTTEPDALSLNSTPRQVDDEQTRMESALVMMMNHMASIPNQFPGLSQPNIPDPSMPLPVPLTGPGSYPLSNESHFSGPSMLGPSAPAPSGQTQSFPGGESHVPEMMASDPAAVLAEGQVDVGGVDQGRSFLSLLFQDDEQMSSLCDDDSDDSNEYYDYIPYNLDDDEYL